MRRFAILICLSAIALMATVSRADVLVGEYGSLTGSQATFGQSDNNGIQLATTQANEGGGVHGQKIKLIVYDDKGQQQDTVTAVTRLVESDHVKAVLGEVASSLSLAGGRVCQRAGVPMVSPSSTNPRVTEIGNMIFRVCFIDPFQGYVGARFAYHNLHLKTAAVLYDRTQAYSTGLAKFFRQSFKKMGGKIISDQAYSGGDIDFSGQLTAIRQANPQFIYVPGYYTDVVNIALQKQKLGLNIPMIGGDGWDSSDLKNAGAALNNCYFSNHYAHQNPSPVVQNFVKTYEATYHEVPDGLAATGYDAAGLLYNAMNRATNLNGQTIAAALADTKNFKAVTGTISIDAHRNAKKPAVILKITNGVPAYFATIAPPK